MPHALMQPEELSMFAPVQKALYLVLILLILSCSCVTAMKSSLQTGPWEKGEKGGEKRFWVIYSGGSRLNQGMTTVWLTYFDLSPCFGIF